MADGLTIHEAAQETGWSPRMLRYVERAGLVTPARSRSGYRMYGAVELGRLRELRDLLARHDLSLADLCFATRMREDADLRASVQHWLDRPQAASEADKLNPHTPVPEIA